MFRAHPTRVLGSDDVVRLADLDGRYVLAQLRKNAMHTLATPSLLESAVVDALVAAVESGPKSVAELNGLAGADDHARMLRTIAWLYKYGIVSVSPSVE